MLGIVNNRDGSPVNPRRRPAQTVWGEDGEAGRPIRPARSMPAVWNLAGSDRPLDRRANHAGL